MTVPAWRVDGVIPGARLISSAARVRARARSASGCRGTTSCPTSPPATCCAPPCSEGTEFGRKAKEYMDAGELVPDDIMIGIVAERLGQRRRRRPAATSSTASPARSARPRRSTRSSTSRPSTSSSTSRCPRELVLERLVGRRVCLDCGTNYSTPAAADVALDLRHLRRRRRAARADDTPEAINQRLDLYEQQTAPLIELLRRARAARRRRRRRPARRGARTGSSTRDRRRAASPSGPA